MDEGIAPPSNTVTDLGNRGPHGRREHVVRLPGAPAMRPPVRIDRTENGRIVSQLRRRRGPELAR
jgi:hypothetical protein